jgi:hypothetical protein
VVESGRIELNNKVHVSSILHLLPKIQRPPHGIIAE